MSGATLVVLNGFWNLTLFFSWFPFFLLDFHALLQSWYHIFGILLLVYNAFPGVWLVRLIGLKFGRHGLKFLNLFKCWVNLGSLMGVFFFCTSRITCTFHIDFRIWSFQNNMKTVGSNLILKAIWEVREAIRGVQKTIASTNILKDKGTKLKQEDDLH